VSSGPGPSVDVRGWYDRRMAKQTKEREDCGCTFSETTGEKATETAVSGGVGGAYGAAAGFLVGSFVPVVGNAVGAAVGAALGTAAGAAHETFIATVRCPDCHEKHVSKSR